MRGIDALADDVILSLVRLNSHARSEWHDRLKRAIYHYKYEMLDVLAASGELQVRRVVAGVKCRDCGGTGHYLRDPYRYDHCWKCDSTGRVVLQFTESTLPGGYVLHTPQWKGPDALERLAQAAPVFQATDWSPNLPGQKLAAADLAQALNAVEDWSYGDKFPRELSIPPWGFTYDEGNWCYYHLSLGETEKRCPYCGRTDDLEPLSHENLLFGWTDYVCSHCRLVHHFDGQDQALPGLLNAQPIQQWLSKRAEWQRRADEDHVEMPF